MPCELPGVLRERATPLGRIGVDGRGVVHDGQQPREERRSGDDERTEREQPGAAVAASPEPADREEPDERDPEEERVRRMHDGEDERGGRRRGEERPGRGTRRLHRKRERGREEQLARRGRGQRERGERPAVRRRHRHERDACGRRGRGGNDAPEQRPTRLVGDHGGKRREHRRAVQHDVDRVGARDLRDQREEAVPQRERVAGMEPAVRELVERVQREVVEREELLHPREMEEAVTADVPGDVPEEQTEHRPGGEDPAACPERPRRRRARANGMAASPADDEQDEGDAERGRCGERDRERREHDRERPRDRRGQAADAERPRDECAGGEDDCHAEDELDEQEHQAISDSASPEPSQAATSR